MAALEIGNHYNLALYATSVLGSVYKGLKLSSIVDYEIASKFASVDLLHKQVYPYLPPGTPSNHKEYTYYIFKNETKVVVLASYWVIQDSIELTGGAVYNVKLENITPQTFAVIRDQLRLLGVTFTVQ